MLDSAIAEMLRVDADAPVVVIAGDFLAHRDFNAASASSTMRTLAEHFDQAFPHAQFVITLGNEDSACGAYAIAPGSPFFRAVVSAWEPLVNRHRASPEFASTFLHDGFYTATLPIPKTNVVAIDDVFWSLIYHPRCLPAGAPAQRAFPELRAALHDERVEKHWIVAHIPPGVDAFSTVHLAHRIAIVPFLTPDQNAAFLQLLADPASHVTLVVAGHLHRFGYRIARGPGDASIPILVVPAISPIYRNAPSFLTVNVDGTGTIRTVAEHALIANRWHDIGGTQSLELAKMTGASLMALQERLADDSVLRATFDRLYSSGRADDIDVNEKNWRAYWCAATGLDYDSFRNCLGEGGVGFLLGRGVIGIGGAGFVAIGVLVLVSRRRRHARMSHRTR